MRSTGEVLRPGTQAQQKTETSPNFQTVESFPNPPPYSTPHHHITKGLVTAVPFTKYIMSGYQERITRHTTRQKTV